MAPHDWFDAFLTYTRSQHDAGGKPYVGEYLDEKTGAFRLIVTEDKRPARSVRSLVSIEVKTAE